MVRGRNIPFWFGFSVYESRFPQSGTVWYHRGELKAEPKSRT